MKKSKLVPIMKKLKSIRILGCILIIVTILGANTTSAATQGTRSSLERSSGRNYVSTGTVEYHYYKSGDTYSMVLKINYNVKGLDGEELRIYVKQLSNKNSLGWTFGGSERSHGNQHFVYRDYPTAYRNPFSRSGNLERSDFIISFIVSEYDYVEENGIITLSYTFDQGYVYSNSYQYGVMIVSTGYFVGVNPITDTNIQFDDITPGNGGFN